MTILDANGNPMGSDPRKREKLVSKGAENDEGLIAAEILGRCSKCHANGTLEFPNNMVFSKDAERVLAYKPIKMKCGACGLDAEFLPTEVRKYTDKNLGVLKNIQDGIKRGEVK